MIAGVTPPDEFVASNTFDDWAGVARWTDMENLLDGLGNAHV